MTDPQCDFCRRQFSRHDEPQANVHNPMCPMSKFGVYDPGRWLLPRDFQRYFGDPDKMNQNAALSNETFWIRSQAKNTNHVCDQPNCSAGQDQKMPPWMQQKWTQSRLPNNPSLVTASPASGPGSPRPPLQNRNWQSVCGTSQDVASFTGCNGNSSGFGPGGGQRPEQEWPNIYEIDTFQREIGTRARVNGECIKCNYPPVGRDRPLNEQRFHREYSIGMIEPTTALYEQGCGGGCMQNVSAGYQGTATGSPVGATSGNWNSSRLPGLGNSDPERRADESNCGSPVSFQRYQ